MSTAKPRKGVGRVFGNAPALAQAAPEKTASIAQPPKKRTPLSHLRSGQQANNYSVTLNEAIALSLKHHAQRKVSAAQEQVAEFRHRQALAAYWPQFTATASASLLSNQPDYIFPATTFGVPGMSISTPPGQLNVSVAAPIPGIPPINAKVPVPAQTFRIPPSQIDIPEQRNEVRGREIFQGGLEMQWLLADGGARKALVEQARNGVTAAGHASRKSDLAVIRDVKRYYQALVLGHELVTIGEDILARLEITLTLTEKLYQAGSQHVIKTDYLRNKVVVTQARSMVNTLRLNRRLSEIALVNALGVHWKSTVTPQDKKLEVPPMAKDLDRLMNAAFRFNPDWNSLEAGLSAAQARVKEKKAAYIPQVALFGNLEITEDGLNNVGYSTDSNNRKWNVGIGIQLPIFDGFLRENRIKEAKAKLAAIKGQQILLSDGLAAKLQVNFHQATTASENITFSEEAVETAAENSSLSFRALREEMIAPEKTFEALIFEALAKARLLLHRYEALDARYEIETLIGERITTEIAPGFSS